MAAQEKKWHQDQHSEEPSPLSCWLQGWRQMAHGPVLLDLLDLVAEAGDEGVTVTWVCYRAEGNLGLFGAKIPAGFTRDPRKGLTPGAALISWGSRRQTHCEVQLTPPCLWLLTSATQTAQDRLRRQPLDTHRTPGVPVLFWSS